MIIAERKPFEEIAESIKDKKSILVLGCGGCVTVCLAGGQKEAEILASELRILAQKEKREQNITEFTIERQCEKEFVFAIKEGVKDKDAILSMACGVGVQNVYEWLNKETIPALNTCFYGYPEEQGVWKENCQGCGNCILAKTGGVCPIALCSKSLLNGPCGGSQNGKCEVSKEMDCGWQLIYDRMKLLGRLHLLEEITPPKDWRTSRDGGIRKIVREELRISEETKVEVKKEQIIGKY